jgi:acetyl esterase/lipase
MSSKYRAYRWYLLAGALLTFAAAPMTSAIAQQQPAAQPSTDITVDADAAVHMPAFTIPFSVFASPEAKTAFLELVAHPFPVGPDPIKTREAFDQTFFIPQVKHEAALFPVTIEAAKIAGVPVDIVSPIDGISPANKDRVLINLHGGAFALGAHWGGELEAIPIAHDGRIKVITVNYREYPEAKYPAATEDLAAVYQELLKQYKPKNIGIYGSSAGGILTAEGIAWFQTHNLPAPGAIGIFSASAGGIGQGDSGYSWPLTAHKPPAPNHSAPSVGYFEGVDLKDPMVSPVYSAQSLAKFPPTLVLTGTRDMAMSSAVYTHAQLVKAGVDAELHVWEGLGHGGYANVDIPEGKEYRDVVVHFFSTHLGRASGM